MRISERKIAHYMKRYSVIIPTKYQEVKEIERHGLVLDPADCSTTYIVGARGSGKTEQACSLYKYFSLLCTNKGNPHIIFDVKRDWLRRFYTKGDIILGFTKSTHQWNIMKEAGNEEGMKTLITEMLPYHPHADPTWVDGSRILGSSCGKALMRYANENDKEVGNSDFLRVLRMPKKEMADFLQKYNSDGDLNSAFDYLTGKSEAMGSSILNSMRTDFEKAFVGDFQGKSNLPYITMEDYIKNPDGHKLFLKYDEMHGLQMEPIFRLLYDLAIMYSFNEKDSIKKRSKFFICDEFSLLKNMDRYSRMLNVGRDYKIYVITCLQSIGQIYDIYGHDNADAIIGGHTLKMFFRTGDPTDRVFAKKSVGDLQEIDTDPDKIVGKKVTVYHRWDDATYDTLKPGTAIVKTPHGANKYSFFLYDENNPVFIEGAKRYYAWKNKKMGGGKHGFIFRR